MLPNLQKKHCFWEVLGLRPFILLVRAASRSWASNLFIAKGHTRYCGLVCGPKVEK